MVKNLKLLVLFFLICGCVSTGLPNINENQGDGGHYIKKFYLSVDKANFFQAFINCKSGGMELASIENELESKSLDAYLNPYKEEGWGKGFWLSGTHLNNVQSKQYYWLSSGKRIIYTNWILPGDPDNYGGGQHCMMWVQFNNKTGWSDWQCEGSLRYVCEYKSLDRLSDI